MDLLNRGQRSPGSYWDSDEVRKSADEGVQDDGAERGIGFRLLSLPLALSACIVPECAHMRMLFVAARVDMGTLELNHTRLQLRRHGGPGHAIPNAVAADMTRLILESQRQILHHVYT